MRVIFMKIDKGYIMEVEINFVSNVGGSSVLVLHINTITPLEVTELVNTLQHHLLDHFMLHGDITESVQHILQIFDTPNWAPVLTAEKSMNLDYDDLNRDYRQWYSGNHTTDICITIRGIAHLSERIAIRTYRRGFFYLSLNDTDVRDVLEEALTSVVSAACSN